MPAAILDYLVPLLTGVLLTMVLEAATGRAWGLVLRKRFLRRAKRRLDALGDHASLIRRGAECLYTIEFVPDGWRREDIRMSWRTSRDLAAALRAADSRHLPLSADDLMSGVHAERARLKEATDGSWNGESLAVVALTTSRSPGDERPTLAVTCAPSDFAAAQVCSTSWMTAFDKDEVTLPADLDAPIPGMVNAVGLNATLVTADGMLVLVRRALRAASARTGLHISVNEGMQERDRNGQRLLDPHVGLARGVHEELGLEVDPECVRFHTAMFDVRRYQFGLLGHVDLSGTGTTAADVLLARRHGLAQDKFENGSIELVPWDFDSVVSALNEPDWVAHGWLNLLHSAVGAFGARAEDLYRLAGVETPRARRRLQVTRPSR